MTPPRIAILLTAAGALPFLLAAAMILGLIPGEGRALIVAYGAVILAFMSGVLWGFAARGGPGLGLCLSVLPALHVFFFVTPHPWAFEGQALAHLIAGFLGVLILDLVYQAKRLAPRWWLSLRIPVTAVVVGCLWVARHA
jgi:hypothetical protein